MKTKIYPKAFLGTSTTWCTGLPEIVISPACRSLALSDDLIHSDRCTCSTAQCFKSTPERTSFYKRTFRRELSYEPEWVEDGTITWPRLQDAEDVRMFLRATEKMIAHCMKKMGPALFKYVGTASTVRDLVAMADVFERPGALINLWTEAHGSVVASYLMKSMSHYNPTSTALSSRCPPQCSPRFVETSCLIA